MLSDIRFKNFSVKTLTSRSCLLSDGKSTWVLMNFNKYKAEDAAVRFAMAAALGEDIDMVEFFESEGVTVS